MGRLLIGIGVLLVIATLAACDTMNVRGTVGMANKGPVLTGTFRSATTWNTGEQATLTVDWGVTGTSPHTIYIDMGAGVFEAPESGPATNPFTQTFTLREGGPFTWTATVTDANGQTGTVTGTYTIEDALNWNPDYWDAPGADPEEPSYYPPAPPGDPLIIDMVRFADGILEVTVFDQYRGPDGAYVSGATVTVTETPELRVNRLQNETNRHGVALFEWRPVDRYQASQGTTFITAEKHYNRRSEPFSFHMSFDPFEVIPGMISAVPQQETTAVGVTVTIVVSSYNGFPEDAAFNYMNGVAVTVEEGGDYVDGTFNIGAVGGGNKESDGIWANLDPQPVTYFLCEDFMMHAAEVEATPGLMYMGFNVTPIGAGETNAAGELFNFGMAFVRAGKYHLDFLKFQDVKRTYYSDNAAVEYYWPDMINDLPGLPNTITVTE